MLHACVCSAERRGQLGRRSPTRAGRREDGFDGESDLARQWPAGFGKKKNEIFFLGNCNRLLIGFES